MVTGANQGYYTGSSPKHVNNNEEMFSQINDIEDEERKAEIREVIVGNNIRLVRYIIKDRYGNGLESMCKSLRITPDDVFSNALFGLVKAVDTFDIDRGFKFATYASRAINNEIGMFMRKAKKTFHDTSMDAEMYQDAEGNGLSISDILPDESSSIDLIDESNFTIWFYDHFSSTLSDRDKEIMHMTFKEEMTQREISKGLGLSQSYISRIVKSLVGRARILYRELEEA